MKNKRPLEGHVQPMVARIARRVMKSFVGTLARSLPARRWCGIPICPICDTPCCPLMLLAMWRHRRRARRALQIQSLTATSNITVSSEDEKARDAGND